MNPVRELVLNLSAKARSRRAEIFRRYFHIDRSTKILDLGSEGGSNIYTVLQTTDYEPRNIFIADIERETVEAGSKQYGFTPVVVDEAGNLPFNDEFFDIVYCSSVIEHVTIPKSQLWKVKSEGEFREVSIKRQRELASEISRLSKQYFVQTPCRTFPIESHTWLPLVGYLPRHLFLPTLRLSNRWWVKKAEPDFNLLTISEMADFFPDGKILLERKLGFTKSIMAVKTTKVIM